MKVVIDNRNKKINNKITLIEHNNIEHILNKSNQSLNVDSRKNDIMEILEYMTLSNKIRL